MKLGQKFTRQYLVYSLLVLLIASGAILIISRSLIREEVDDKLSNSMDNIKSLIHNGQTVWEQAPFLQIDTVQQANNLSIFNDTAFSYNSNEKEDYRQLTETIKYGRLYLRVTLREAIPEKMDFYKTLSLTLLISTIILFLLFFLIGKKVSNSVWKPFYDNLSGLSEFSLEKQEVFDPEPTGIWEFDELNKTLNGLTRKVLSDYMLLKRFAEDASHELQTPLALIKLKSESLLNSSSLDSDSGKKLNEILEAVNRLQRINKGLLILANIQNRQFSKIENISLGNEIQNKIEELEDLAEQKELKITLLFKENIELNADSHLIGILINNLVYNAIKHCTNKGNISVRLEDRMLEIANTGEPLKNPERIFERFYTEQASGSTGLGLAIVKEICNSIDITISYQYLDGLHTFKLGKF